MLKVGQVAPDFEATLDDGSSLHLAELRGTKNVVLYFYPADFTGGCTREACSFRDAYAGIRDLDAVIVGVSRDSVESHQRFKQKNSLAYPIISDEDSALARLYEVVSAIPHLRPRVTYVIDKQGVIRAAFRHDILVDRHINDAVRALDAIEGELGGGPDPSCVS